MKRSLLIFACLYLFNNAMCAHERVVVILGPPGSGKGTQTQLLAKALGWPSPSTDNIFLDDKFTESSIANIYKSYVRKDKQAKEIFKIGLMMLSISNNNCHKPIIFESWPISTSALNTLLLSRDKRNMLVVELVVREEILLERISARKQCPQCGMSYGHAREENILNVCDGCHADIRKRSHDNDIDFPQRLLKYKAKQRTFREVYDQQGIVIHQIAAEGDPLEIHEQIKRLALAH